MKADLPKPLVAALVTVALVAVGFFFWNATKPTEVGISLSDSGPASAEQIAEIKARDHAGDRSRSR